MTKVDSHKVRVSFNHGNAMSLDLKGCGSIYIEPNKEYFFENAPMMFINYLAQLRRLGVTYKLTDNKKGCYMTIDLTGYQTNEPKTILGNLRSNLVQTNITINRPSPVKDSDNEDYKVEDLIPKGTFAEDIQEIVIPDVKESTTDISTDLKESELLTEDDLNDLPIVNDSTTEPTTPEVEETEVKEESKEEVVYLSESKLLDLNKADLLEYARSIDTPEVSDINTKKEIREAIIKHIDSLK